MNRTSLNLSISRVLPLVFALAAVLIWASIANAQTESQTYTPVDTPVAAAGTSAGSGGDAGAGDAAAGVAAASAGEGEGEGSSALGISLLPTTGGPLLPLIGLGAIALGATGLLARNRYGRR